jgi:hypothetical protein
MAAIIQIRDRHSESLAYHHKIAEDKSHKSRQLSDDLIRPYAICQTPSFLV